ncbi:MAG TPA: hypothetical protein VD866_06575 [Urbifossiella sp.]|nr:hypothetical protein [Urbifossiella sp.]
MSPAKKWVSENWRPVVGVIVVVVGAAVLNNTFLRIVVWPVAVVVIFAMFRDPIVSLLRESRNSPILGFHSRDRRHLFVGILIVLVVLAIWWFGQVWIENAFPISEGTSQQIVQGASADGKEKEGEKADAIWQRRGQFGDMFGAITCILAALSLAFVIYGIFLQVSEASKHNEITKWVTNYTYLLDAKKLITDHPEVLELHGLPKDLHTQLKVTPAQVAYVVIDLKAADLYYRLDGSDPVKLTDYRRKMLVTPLYRTIAKECVVAGTLLPSSPFIKALREELGIPDEVAVP